jgi:hypothetical protein
MVLDALKKRLHDAANSKGGKWIKELPNALWGLRTQPSKPTEQSPYFLVYGSEAILPTDVMWDSPAVEEYDEVIHLKIADELISMDSMKLVAPPSSNQQGTLRVSDATMIATSRNAPSTLVISSSTASRTRKDYTSSAHLVKVPSQSQR